MDGFIIGLTSLFAILFGVSVVLLVVFYLHPSYTNTTTTPSGAPAAAPVALPPVVVTTKNLVLRPREVMVAPSSTGAGGAWTSVRSGPLNKADFAACLAGQEPTCFGQNAGAPYYTFNLATSTVSPLLSVQLQNSAFPLLPNQVFAVFGKAPPASKYWSYNIYLLRDSNRCGGTIVFATVADAVNNFNTPAIQPGDSFAIIYGTNTDTLTNFNVNLGNLPADHIVRVRVPYLGTGAVYSVVERVAIFEDPQAQAAYDANTNTAGSLYQYSGPVNPAANVAQFTYGGRATYFDENVLLGARFDARAAESLRVVQASLPGYTSAFPISVNTLHQSIDYDTGYDCIKNCVNCNGDNRDTVYFVAYIPYVIEPGNQVVYVYGMNHTSTGKSAYTNVTVYDNATDFGVVSTNFAEKTPENYQVLVTPSNFDQSNTLGNRDVRILVLPSGVTEITISERAYVQTLDSTSGLSAEPSTLIRPKVWVLSKTENPTSVISID